MMISDNGASHTKTSQSSTDSVVQTLACAAARTPYVPLPDSVRHQALDLFLDTLAVCAAGLSNPSYANYALAHRAEAGVATLLGCADGVPVNTAVLINAGASTVLQLQDGHRMARGHPASHIVPTVFALAEERDATAAQVIAAFVAGYEVGARIGIAMDGLNHFLHDTGTWSTIGTAVAAAHLLTDGDESVIATALDAAAAVALMPYRDLPVQGASAHHMYIGLGATTGLTAARASVAGLAALPGTLVDFFGPRAGAAFNPEVLTDGIAADGSWRSFEMENAYFKVHPTCAHLHGANDGLVRLIQTHDLTSDSVERVEIATYAAGLAFDNPAPENALAARFSQKACAAIALCSGALDETTLTDDALRSAAVQEMMARVTVRHDAALDADYPAGRPARVTVTLKGGQTLLETVTYPLGDHTNPATRATLRAKSQRLLAVRFGQTQADAVVAAFEGYTGGGPLSVLTAALRAPAQA